MKNKDFINADYTETIFYMGIIVSKQFKMEQKWLIIDNYYDCINELVRDYISKGYNALNEGLLECINRYVNDNEVLISNRLAQFEVLEY